MYSFSSFTPSELLEKYKRQTYLIIFPFGLLLAVLYMTNVANTLLQYYVAAAIFLELSLFIFLILFFPPIKYAMEVVFCFSTPIYFLILTQVRVDPSILNAQNQTALGDPVYSLCMWLIVLLIGAFLSLKPVHVNMFIGLIFAGTILVMVNNLWQLHTLNQLQSPLIYRWVNAFISMAVATLLVQRVGLLQQRNASTDALTGILNRHALIPILDHELNRSVRYARPFSIVILDIDEFKVVNDTFGHLEGDKVLRDLAKLVNNLLRKTDYIGRWGGEEFLLVLPETDNDSARNLAERIRVKLRETYVAENYVVSASFGVATHQEDWKLEDLLDGADKALYAAKNNGRDQVVVFQKAMN
jgi:diguanylate cyclase (GGDEF)-like protein